MKSADNLIWIDLEMTGLDPDRDRIIEIATIVTDRNLAVLADGPVIAVHQPEAALAAMDGRGTWCGIALGLAYFTQALWMTPQGRPIFSGPTDPIRPRTRSDP